MGEVLIPTWINPDDNGESYEWRDDTTQEFTPQFGPGPSQRQSYGGHRLLMRRMHRACRAEERSILATALANGREDVIRTKVHFALRGSFPATELVVNGTFANGTTGWTFSGGSITQTVADRVMRSQAGQNVAASTDFIRANVAIAVTLYVPYALRYFLQQGRYSYGSMVARLRDSGTGTALVAVSAPTGTAVTGLITSVYAPDSANVVCAINVASTSGSEAGDHILCPYVSLARCVLVDAGPNQFTQSDAVDHVDWTKAGVTVPSGAYFTAPDGNLTGDHILEDTSNGGHSFWQDETKAATAEDWCVAGAFRQGDQADARTRVALRIQDTSTTDLCEAIFDLSNGTVVQVTNSGAAINGRAFIRAMGGSGWYYCALVGRTDAETTVRGRALLVQSGTTTSYTGVVTGDIGCWRLTFAKSSVPVKLTASTTATDADGTPYASGATAIYVKGLPASTNGLLLPFDWAEINGEAKQVTASLNSDAAGLGYLQFRPALVRAVADNDPIIVCNPMGKFLPSPSVRGTQRFTTQSDFEYELRHVYE